MPKSDNPIEKSLKMREEVLEILRNAFLEHKSGEDNSWRVRHNLIVLEMQMEIELARYFNEINKENKTK